MGYNKGIDYRRSNELLQSMEVYLWLDEDQTISLKSPV